MPDFSSALWNKPAVSAEAAAYSVDYSCRFNDNSSNYLVNYDTGGSEPTDGTISFWVKRGHLGADQGTNYGQLLFRFESDASGGYPLNQLLFRSTVGSLWSPDDALMWNIYTTVGDSIQMVTTALFRDPSAWYHIMAVHDSSGSTTNDFTASDSKCRLYVNGKQVTAGTSTTAGTNPLIGSNFALPSSGKNWWIGRNAANDNEYLDGYLADYHFVPSAVTVASDGSSVFAEADSNGQYVPIEYTGSHGTTGFHLDFADSSDLGADASANSNDFTGNNLDADHQVIDTPSSGKNFATLNSLTKSPSCILYESSLEPYPVGTGTLFFKCVSTFGESSGKWYAEAKVGGGGGNRGYVGASLRPSLVSDANQNGVESFDATISFLSNNIYVGGDHKSSVTYSLATGDIVGIAIDADLHKIYFFKNGSAVGDASGYTFGASGDSYFFSAGVREYLVAGYSYWNFGQDPTFAGTKSAGAGPYADSGGSGSFYYEPPSGFNAVCSKNITAPGLNNAVTPAFDIKLYEGNGSTSNRDITGLALDPDMVWLKERDAANYHRLVDSVRGASSSAGTLYPNDATLEYGATNGSIVDLIDEGFTIGTSNSAVNGSNTLNSKHVAWTWKAGTTGTRENGDINSTSTGYAESYNADAGFSIIKYNSGGSGEAMDNSGSMYDDLAHSLNSPVELGLFKMRNPDDGMGGGSQSWVVFHKDLDDGKNLYLDTNGSQSTDNNFVDPANVSSGSVLGDNHISLYYGDSGTGSSGGYGVNRINDQSADGQFIAYLFRSVEGYSKVGSYTGNGDPDGSFVYCGFRPAYVLLKRKDTGHWIVIDSARDTYNVTDAGLLPALPQEEGTGYPIDILSNGFKLRTTGTAMNASVEFIFYAVAELPFQYASAR